MAEFNRSGLRRLSALTLLVLLLSACGSTEAPSPQPRKVSTQGMPISRARDWGRFPAIIERDTSAEVVALGDVHGGYERLVKLLSVGNLITQDARSSVGYSWTGGTRILVCTGDLIDKGDHSLAVLDLMMALESQARPSGGEVIVTLGNHEAEFLADPGNEKSSEFRAELQTKGIDPVTLRQGQQPYGEWIMRRPLAARINDWFFAHAGNTTGKSISELSAGFRQVVDAGDWKSKLLIGDRSLLEAREWWKHEGGKKELLDGYLQVLKAKHIAFGHDPSAFHNKGEIGQELDGRIFLIDVGMSPAIDYSHGALLLIDRSGRKTIATSLDAQGMKKELWRE